jgi:hypothetical protein
VKACRTCLAELLLEDFHLHSGASDGRRKDCKTCRSGAVKARRHQRPERSILTIMVQRCHNPKHPKFHLYGGRGIAVCERWRESFDAFLADMGPRPSPKHSVDRKDNDLGYEPGNCRWATQTEQCRNKRTNRLLSVRGKTVTVAEWATESGTPARLIAKRLELGWTAEDAIFAPVRGRAA